MRGVRSEPEFGTRASGVRVVPEFGTRVSGVRVVQGVRVVREE